MKMTLLSSTGLGLLLLPFSLFADTQSYYCPQNHGYINVGMTPDEVIAACGQPISQQESNQPVMQKIPVQQLIYNNMGTSTAFYGVWNIPTGSGGVQLEIDIVNQKVRSIKMNGSSSNAISVCQGANIQAGDPVQKVYYACGSPSMVNNSFINEIVPTATKPIVWIYQPGEYQPTVSMTFVNGKLQSIQ
ncbi:hypothetical protein DGG96_01835 [Legionella qingyii]|uniref:DUF2845 domain-containing protein n=1 Tax=Legionella qingyii TaxID=2184757 RepID=A0A317UAM5_9GAMM|nr:DUF2845 domain-containing protein [Legionella qingyii]PWY57480.1 hypothetical protein DGG96_01835 [Legionella qingyii]RUR23337.1 DUF2845 domain-containing protein [Legionella qingyii]RUR26563.1 DUF2845 domain-containing protein [Legionella qingyii]